MQKFNLINFNGQNEFDFKSWNAEAIYFFDPSGNILEFIARHSLNNKTENDFSGNNILSVSEIGMPVHDVKNFYDRINEVFKTPVFSGDMKSFTAAGDDKGLFIIVPEKRNWYPGCSEAGIFPIKVKIVSDFDGDLKFNDLPYQISSSNK